MYSFRCSGLKVKVDPCVNLNCKFLFVCKIKIIINCRPFTTREQGESYILYLLQKYFVHKYIYFICYGQRHIQQMITKDTVLKHCKVQRKMTTKWNLCSWSLLCFILTWSECPHSVRDDCTKQHKTNYKKL